MTTVCILLRKVYIMLCFRGCCFFLRVVLIVPTHDCFSCSWFVSSCYGSLSPTITVKRMFVFLNSWFRSHVHGRSFPR